jgi:N-acetylmuramoyl-L-alanine amidase CwlA
MSKLLRILVDFVKALLNRLSVPKESHDQKEEEKSMYLEKKTTNLLTLGGKNRPGTKLKRLDAIVLHWIGPYANQVPDNARTWWEKGEVFGSAHYVVGKKGEILVTIPDDEVAYHAGSTTLDPVSKKIHTDFARKLFGESVTKGSFVNSYSIGIEMIPIDNAPGTLSQETLDAVSEICVYTLTKHKKTVLIVTDHWETVGWKRCPEYWVQFPEKFVAFKKQLNKKMPPELQVPDTQIIQNYP